MNSTKSAYGASLDRHTKMWSRSAYGLPTFFYDWFRDNMETTFSVIYSRHARDEHEKDFSGEYNPRSSVKDILFSQRWQFEDFSFKGFCGSDVFECHYDERDYSRPRKFHMNLPFIDNKGKEYWHPKYNYSGVFCANLEDPNKLMMSSVWARPVNLRSNKKDGFEKGNSIPTDLLLA